MEKKAPVHVRLCFPETEQGRQELAKRVAALHVDAAGRQAGGEEREIAADAPG